MFSIKHIKTFWIWVLLIFIALFFISSNLGKRRSWKPSERFVVEIIAPLKRLLTKTVDVTEGVWSKYFGLINTHNENIRMKREIDSLRIENFQYRELLAAHKRLQNLLQFKDTTDQPVVAAQVIGRDPTGWFESVIIDKGTTIFRHSQISLYLFIDWSQATNRCLLVLAPTLSCKNRPRDCLEIPSKNL